MKKYSRSDVFLSFAIIGGLVFVGVSLFGSFLCFQKSPDDIRKDGIELEGKVVKKTESVALYANTSSTFYYLDLEVLGDTTEEDPIRVQISEKPFRCFKEGEIVPVWRYKGAYRVDKYGAMDIIPPLPFFAVAVVGLVLFATFIVKYRVAKNSGTYDQSLS